MKSQGDIARVGVDAAAVEVGRRSEILLNDAQYPVLIGPLLLLRLFNGLAPLRRKAVQGKPLTVEDRTLLGLPCTAFLLSGARPLKSRRSRRKAVQGKPLTVEDRT